MPCDHHAACVQPSRPTPPRNLCTTTSLLKLYVAWPPTSLDTLSVMFLTSPTTNSWDQLKAVCPSLLQAISFPLSTPITLTSPTTGDEDMNLHRAGESCTTKDFNGSFYLCLVSLATSDDVRDPSHARTSSTSFFRHVRLFTSLACFCAIPLTHLWIG